MNVDIAALKLEVISEAIDRLVTLDFHARGVMVPLYDAARAKAGRSFCLAAAERLVETVKSPKSVVLIGAGFPIGAVGKPETDGLIGAVALARGLVLGLGAQPVIVTEEEAVAPMAAAAEAAELNVYHDIDSALARPKSVVILHFTKDEATARRDAETLVDKISPVMVVSIERPGRNDHGIYHGAIGWDMSYMVAKIDHVFMYAAERGLPTIAVGDLGNELGMGALRECVSEHTPFGSKCQCPCGAGNACTVSADVTVVGAVSDDAVYGMLGCLSYLLGMPDVLHSAEMEERIIRAAVTHGCIDGPSECPKEAIDMIEARIHGYIIEIIRNMFRYADIHTSARPEFLQYLAQRSRD